MCRLLNKLMASRGTISVTGRADDFTLSNAAYNVNALATEPAKFWVSVDLAH